MCGPAAPAERQSRRDDPLACQDWANTKAAYRFFANPKVEEGEILSGHLEATRVRCAANDGPILLLQDTTEFTYQRRNPHDVGFTKAINSGRDKNGLLRHHAVCGILMHSNLAVTEDGLPLGLTAVKFWNCEKFKGTAQLKRKINPTRVPIEAKESIRWLDNLRQSLALLGQPERCVHIGDRESWTYRCQSAGKAVPKIVPLPPRTPCWKGLGADSEEKREPVSDINTAIVEGGRSESA